MSVYVSAYGISHLHRHTMYHICTCADDLNQMHSHHLYVYVSAYDKSHLHRHIMLHMYFCI